jgi:hypothetical protein
LKTIVSPQDAWTIRRLQAGLEINGELQEVSPGLRPIVEYLAGLPLESRSVAWAGYLCASGDPAGLVRQLAAADPEGPAPAAEAPRRCATLADVRRVLTDTTWPWPGWPATGVLNALASDPGIGKTVLAASLAQRLWLGEKWPDGQVNPFPAETRTLWVPADRHYPQLLDLGASYGLPDEALLLNAAPEDPTAGLDLDDAAVVAELAGRVEAERPGLVIVDTVGMTTTKNLCRPEDARLYFQPLMEIAQRTGIAFLLLTHLSKDGEALGRRIVGACRVAWKLTNPDPVGLPDRRWFGIDKSYLAKPPPLGMTIAATGCTFDFEPPSPPEPERGGRPPKSREKASKFIVEALTARNDRLARELCKEWEKAGGSAAAFWRARDELVEAGDLVCDGKPMLIHLTQSGAARAQQGKPPG